MVGSLLGGQRVQALRVSFLDMARDGLEDAVASDSSLPREGWSHGARFTGWEMKAMTLSFFLGFYTRRR